MKLDYAKPDDADQLLKRVLGGSLQEATMRLVVGAAVAVFLVSLLVWLI